MKLFIETYNYTIYEIVDVRWQNNSDIDEECGPQLMNFIPKSGWNKSPMHPKHSTSKEWYDYLIIVDKTDKRAKYRFYAKEPIDLLTLNDIKNMWLE